VEPQSCKFFESLQGTVCEIVIVGASFPPARPGTVLSCNGWDPSPAYLLHISGIFGVLGQELFFLQALQHEEQTSCDINDYIADRAALQAEGYYAKNDPSIDRMAHNFVSTSHYESSLGRDKTDVAPKAEPRCDTECYSAQGETVRDHCRSDPGSRTEPSGCEEAPVGSNKRRNPEGYIGSDTNRRSSNRHRDHQQYELGGKKETRNIHGISCQSFVTT
jgi:hypothetical protein